MELNFQTVIFFILLIDSIGANLIAWTDGSAWYRKNFRTFSRWFPATKGWCTYYFILVLWIAYLTF